MIEDPDEVGDVEDWWLWTDNVPAWELWLVVQTQWRTGMDGHTGLDYGAVESAMRMTATPRSEWRERFAELRVMERAALRAWNDVRKVQT